ncbi:MAG: hypothetical protein MJ075_03510 [Oscillospiraceae bacterium]|nr:hypothetical protein [Oscillospiraceae bacterium]
MKKKSIILCLLAIALIAAGFCIREQQKSSQEKQELFHSMLEEAYTNLGYISNNLNLILTEFENPRDAYGFCIPKLTLASSEFVKLHDIFTQFAGSFPPRGTSRNIYTGSGDFETLSYVLLDGTGYINGREYDCLLYDNTINLTELQFLSELKDDLDAFIIAMETTDSSSSLNRNLSVSELNRILNLFFDKWSWSSGSSPLELLLRDFPANEHRVIVDHPYVKECALNPSYAAGEEVILRLNTCTESYFVVTANGNTLDVDLDLTWQNPLLYTYFVFTMPDEDVEVVIEVVDVDTPIG